MPDYCIYLRKSRTDMEAECRGEGETLLRHEKALTELAQKMHLDVGCVYREIVSGETISARPVMQKLLEEVENNRWSGVLVMEIERLARGNTIDQGTVAQTFKLSQTKIITPMKIYDPSNEFDEEYFEFGLFMSRREYKTINRRLQRGKIASVKEGKYVAASAPYGYNKKKIENGKGFTLEPNKNEAKTVKLIFEFYTKGEMQIDGSYKRLGTGLIANKLNNLKIPPKKGSAWAPSSIRDILINPIYIGKIRWNWRKAHKKIVNGEVKIKRPRSSPEDCILVDGLHKPIIEQKTFELAQSLMKKDPPRPTNTYSVVKNPLAGIIICGKCGKKMVRRPYSEKTRFDAIICTTKACSNVSCALPCLEGKILEALKSWLGGYELKWQPEKNKKLPEQIKCQKSAIEKIEKEIEKTKLQINKIHDLLEQGVYSNEMFLKRYSLNTQKILQLEKDKTALENGLKKKNSRKTTPKIKTLFEVYKNLKTPKAKNDMLKEILKKIVYTKNKSGRWHNSPDNFEIILYPKLPDSSAKLI